MTFRKGMEEMQATLERQQQRSGGSRRFFKWEAGEDKAIRFLTDGDEIVLATLHEFVPCHDGSKRSFVCRQEVGEECELCSNPEVKKREVGYGIAIWREPNKTNGKTAYKTKTEVVEVEENGKKVDKVVPWVGILQQAPKNFWAYFFSAFDKYGTLLDRDYSITRRGAKMDTQYNGFPEDPQVLDLSKFDEYKPNIEEMLTYQASKEYYDRHLHGVEADKDPKPSEDSQLTDEDLETLRKANEEIAASAASGDFD